MHYLTYREPDNLETIVNLNFEIHGYPGAKAKFTLKKSKKPCLYLSAPYLDTPNFLSL